MNTIASDHIKYRMLLFEVLVEKPFNVKLLSFLSFLINLKLYLVIDFSMHANR